MEKEVTAKVSLEGVTNRILWKKKYRFNDNKAKFNYWKMFLIIFIASFHLRFLSERLRKMKVESFLYLNKGQERK